MQRSGDDRFNDSRSGAALHGSLQLTAERLQSLGAGLFGLLLAEGLGGLALGLGLAGSFSGGQGLTLALLGAFLGSAGSGSGSGGASHTGKA